MKILPILTARSNTAHTAYPARMAHGDVSVPARLARDACRTKAFRSYYFELVEPVTCLFQGRPALDAELFL